MEPGNSIDLSMDVAFKICLPGVYMLPPSHLVGEPKTIIEDIQDVRSISWPGSFLPALAANPAIFTVLK